MQRGGRGGGGFRGGGRSFGGRGGGGRGFGGGGRGGGRGFQDYGPPSEVIEAGIFEHPCEGEAVCKLSIDKVGLLQPFPCALHVTSRWASRQQPGTSLRCNLDLHIVLSKVGNGRHAATALQVPYFNAPMFLQNKTQIGRIEEIFGGITNTVCHPFTCYSMLQYHASHRRELQAYALSVHPQPTPACTYICLSVSQPILWQCHVTLKRGRGSAARM